jgi:hypothetical protein
MQDIKVKFAYKAGFRRLWFVLSLLWAVTVLVIVLRDDDITPIYGFWMAVVPAAGVYLIAAVLVWVIEGFAKPYR